MLGWALALGCDGLFAGRDITSVGTFSLAFASCAAAAGMSRKERVAKHLRLAMTFACAIVFALAWAFSLLLVVPFPGFSLILIHAVMVAVVACPLFYCVGAEIAAGTSEAPPLVSLALTTCGAGIGWVISQLLLKSDPWIQRNLLFISNESFMFIGILIAAIAITLAAGGKAWLPSNQPEPNLRFNSIQNLLLGTAFSLLIFGAASRAYPLSNGSWLLSFVLPIMIGTAALLPNRLVERVRDRDVQIVFYVGLLISLTASCLLPLFIQIAPNTTRWLLILTLFLTVLPIFRASFIISKRLIDITTGSAAPLAQYALGIGTGALLAPSVISLTNNGNVCNILALMLYTCCLLLHFRTPSIRPAEPALKKIA